MSDKIWNVLVLCTGNSARSIMAEALFNVLGQGRFRAYSAGSRPTGRVHPLAVDNCRAIGYPVMRLRSKSWDEFAAAGAPPMDFVITVCDNAAGELCPVWPGQPITAHWGFEDPAAFEGSETDRQLEFGQVFAQIRRRVELFVALPLATLDRLAIRHELERIGATTMDRGEPACAPARPPEGGALPPSGRMSRSDRRVVR